MEAQKGKRAAQKEATQAKLLAVAKRAFERDGFESVSFRALAREAGVSTGSFFAHWKDKADLFQAACGRSPPDFATFLEEVAIETAGSGLAERALEMRRDLIGTGR